MELEKYHDSIEMYTEALEIKPSNKLNTFNLLYDRAFASSKIGNFRDAIEDCTKALLIDAIHTETRLLRAECNFYLDEFEACIRDYEVALSTTEMRTNPERASLINPKVESARLALRRKQAELKNAEANEQFNLQNYSLAEALYTKAIDMWPDNIVYYGNRCMCLIKQKDYKRALRDSRHMISLDKTFTIGFDRLIRCSLILGHYDVAEQANKTLEQNNAFRETANQYADMCKKLREHEKLASQSYADKQFLSASI